MALMPKSAYTPAQLWLALLPTYRTHPGSHYKAAKATGAAFVTCRRMWEQGVPGENLKPLKDVIEEEKKAARASQAPAVPESMPVEPPEPPRMDEKQAAIRTRAKLGKLCEATREVGMGVLGIVAGQLSAVHKLTGRLDKELAALAQDPWIAVERDADGNPTKYRRVEPGEILSLQERATRTAKNGVLASLAALQMERLHLGLPTVITEQRDVTLEEAIAAYKQQSELLVAETEQAKERGLLVIEASLSR